MFWGCFSWFHFVYSVVKRLAGKKASTKWPAYFMSSGLSNLNSVNQSYWQEYDGTFLTHGGPCVLRHPLVAVTGEYRQLVARHRLSTFRKQQFENQLLMNTWKVKWEDIEPLRSGKGGKDGSTVRVLFRMKTFCCSFRLSTLVARLQAIHVVEPDDNLYSPE